MPLPPNLPYDILVNIIEILFQTENQTELSAMSLTCRSMVSPCQTRLFSAVSLAPRTWDKSRIIQLFPMGRPQLLKKTMLAIETVEHLAESSPHILSYVRTLIFISRQSNHKEEGLSSVLLKFDNLQHLSVEFYEKFEFTAEPYSWNSFPQRYQLVLSRLIHHTSLRSVSIIGLEDFPLSILISARHLISLSLTYCYLPSNASVLQRIVPSDTSIGPLPLRELTISYCGIGFILLLGQSHFYGPPIINPTTLETLKLELSNPWEQSNKSWDRSVFKQVSNLKSLCIRDTYRNRPENLVHVLRSLHPDSHTSMVDLEYDITYGHQPLEDSDSFASSMLLCDLKLPSLKKLKLYMRNIGGEPEAVATLLLEEFKKLDIIVGGSHFPSLKQVYIQVGMIYYIPGPQVRKSQSARDTHFTRISSNPSIEFTYKFLCDLPSWA